MTILHDNYDTYWRADGGGLAAQRALQDGIRCEVPGLALDNARDAVSALQAYWGQTGCVQCPMGRRVGALGLTQKLMSYMSFSTATRVGLQTLAAQRAHPATIQRTSEPQRATPAALNLRRFEWSLCVCVLAGLLD